MSSTQRHSLAEDQDTEAENSGSSVDREDVSNAHEQAADAYRTRDRSAAEAGEASSENESAPDPAQTPALEIHELETHEEFIRTSEDEPDDAPSTEDTDDEEGNADVSLRGKRILLIEDDEEFATGITEYLNELGIDEVLLARNAEAGLSYLADRETFPHVVLLELALIGMDGIQFLAQLRASKHRRLQNLPAVVITMLDNPSIYRRAANQKVGAFLRKPVAVPALRDGLKAALRGDIVEKPFSRPKSWLDEVDEEELRAKREANIAKASAKAQKHGLLVRLLNALIPWSGKA